jgi:hypothetical protein
MKALKIEITRFISIDQPGFVECRFRDAWNKEFIIEEKIPVVTTEDLDETSTYPKNGFIACEIIREWEGENNRKLITIDISKPWSVETNNGLTQFDVSPEDLIEI